jgi:hypothetical protein
MTTAYHAKYFAHELTRRRPAAGLDRLSMSLFDACVDLNPHQIEAARFALQSPLSKGAILADEVGLGKTIEAGIVLCQYWAERRRRIIVICPASLRKQWSLELEEKFNLPTIILDARTYRQAQKDGNPLPFQTNAIIIVSINFASRMADEVKAVAWDLAVIDEAHKLRNAYRPSNRMGQRLRWALEDRRKLLLTATPLQNTLLELYGLSTIIDDLTFGDVLSFRSQFMRQDSDLDALRSRLRGFCQRTLRNQVTEYIQYTERRAITQPFRPTDDEHRLYETLSEFFNREETYSIPARQRNLTALILRKLLASSSHAIAGTLDTMKERLIALRDGLPAPDDFTETLIAEEEMEDELLEPAEEDGEPTEGAPPPSESPAPSQPPKIDREKLLAEIAELDRYVTWSRSIGIDTKSRALLKALNVGFSEMAKMGAPRKALVFTESRRTQNYLRDFLEANGFGGRIVLFNGTNTAADTRAIYDRWLESNRETGRATGSRQIDVRTAVIEHFRDGAEVMIATEAAAEGVNLQFCSLVINYDLPWNPQRIEQRIGRCHRYGQKHDVVVVNFLNQRNEADRRVLELLTEKFNLFSGVFGSSDEVLGSIESGVDFEKRILGIYQTCRTPQEIAAAFRRLRREMDASIQAGMDKARRTLLEHFDEDVHARLRVQLDASREHLDHVARLFWAVTRYMLREHATFDDDALTFDLHTPPNGHIRSGSYHLISKTRPNVSGEFLYRLSHPLGEHVLETARQVAAPTAHVRFDVSTHPTHIAAVEALRGRSGWLALQRLLIESFEPEEYLLFSAFDQAGRSLDQETCEKLFRCDAAVNPIDAADDVSLRRLEAEATRHAEATIARSLEANNRYFQQERERLDKWADDMVLAAEKELADVKALIRAKERQARQAATTEEQHRLQSEIRDLEKKKRRQRQRIFDVEDEIKEKRDELIAKLEARLSQRTTTQRLFAIRWSVA